MIYAASTMIVLLGNLMCNVKGYHSHLMCAMQPIKQIGQSCLPQIN
jgi:hypothetical protein